MEPVLHGCGLPAAWAGQPRWRILDTGFGLGARFLAAWRAWQADPQRPAMLHYVGLGLALQPGDLPELAPQWEPATAGMQRVVLEGGRVLLTLCAGEPGAALRTLDFAADSVLLDTADPRLGELHVLKSLSRLCRAGTRLAGSANAHAWRQDLAQCGFSVAGKNGLQAVYAPAWTPRGLRGPGPVPAGSCAVVGAGLAGAAVAASLARRGWQVQVLDAAPTPAAGASGLPAGLAAPLHSPDDSLLSQLTRSGLRATWQQARSLLREGLDWQCAGVQELRPEGEPVWHAQAGWIKPAELVRAWLAQPGIGWHGNARISRIVRSGDDWQLLDTAGGELGRACLVVVAAAHGSAALLDGAFPLQPVRGQVSWGHLAPGQALHGHPVKGNGHVLPCVPVEGGAFWLCGSTYDRDDTDLWPRHADHAANLGRLRGLLPGAAAQLEAGFASGTVQAWTGVRCTSADRRPLLGEVQPGLWLSTAMGSRGLSFAVLCAELLAARLHGEPLPLPRRLAAALDLQR